MKIFAGIDNGVTGTIAVVKDGNCLAFIETPIKKEQSYTKKKDIISRIDSEKLVKFFEDLMQRENLKSEDFFAVIERPMINPTRFKASISAARSLEATQTVLEILQIPYQFIDSREWQKSELPKGYEGPELKKASADIGCRLFPAQSDLIRKHKDADGLLIAYYAYKAGL